MRLTVILVVMTAFIIITGPVQAQISMTYSSGGTEYFTMSLPDEWRVNVGSESRGSDTGMEGEAPRVISAMPNDGVPLWFGIWVPAGLGNIQDGEVYWSSLGLDLLEDVVVAKREFDSLNELEYYRVSGTGTKEGEAMDFHAAFIQLTGKHVAIAIYIGPREATMSYGEELTQMISSLQPLAQ